MEGKEHLICQLKMRLNAMWDNGQNLECRLSDDIQ